MSTIDIPWVEPGPYTGSVLSQREYALAIARALRSEARVWLGAHEHPESISIAESAASASQSFDPTPRDIALVVPTSGSTGTPKSVAHSHASLMSSIRATAARLGGHGAWFLMLPPTHIAGVQVIARAAVTSSLMGLHDHDELPGALAPLVDLSQHFSARTLVERVEAWDERTCADASLATLPLFTSFVPTQLERIVAAAEAGDTAVADSLRRFEAILVGGAPSSAELRARATAIGARLVTTYGSSETAGGCVYDGEPLEGVELSVTSENRLLISADSIALGYVSESGALTSFDAAKGRATARQFLTSDLARIEHDPATKRPVLHILGRSDDVIISGGRKIVPQTIEEVLSDSAEFTETLVVGVEHAEWGQQAVALVVPKKPTGSPIHTGQADSHTHQAVAAALAAANMERYMIPRHVINVGQIPRLESGKVDRRKASDIAHRTLHGTCAQPAEDHAETPVPHNTRHTGEEHVPNTAP